jgi:hypothetical protein
MRKGEEIGRRRMFLWQVKTVPRSSGIARAKNGVLEIRR